MTRHEVVLSSTAQHILSLLGHEIQKAMRSTYNRSSARQ